MSTLTLTLFVGALAMLSAMPAYFAIKKIGEWLNSAAPRSAAPVLSYAGFIALYWLSHGVSLAFGAELNAFGPIEIAFLLGHVLALVFLNKNPKWAWR